MNAVETAGEVFVDVETGLETIERRPGRTDRMSRRKTCKEGADGRLYHLRDGRAKLIRRDRALAWARRRAPDAVERLTPASDVADGARAREAAVGDDPTAALVECGWRRVRFFSF